MSRSRIFEPGKNCWRIGQVSESGLLIDARDYYRAFYRAARAAERYILLSGWQFDSSVALLRGQDAGEAGEEAPLLSFLNSLCEAKPELRIFILAWDFSMIYGLDREWFQELYFNWTTNERLQFCFDQCTSFDASHHQKFAVIDGKFAFVGGLDICAARWDERDHRVRNPLRVEAAGTPYRSFHDIQSYHRGALARDLAELFSSRWKIVSCADFELPDGDGGADVEIEPTLRLAANEVAISRTQTEASCSANSVFEIRALFLDAIAAADRLIYVENQYFSSVAMFEALSARMKDSSRPKLDIVLMIAKDAEAFLEQLSIGIMQSRLVRQLREIAEETGHRLGIYFPCSVAEDGAELETYIHSKLLLVDDRFLTVGSANMNNRSLGYDTELNVAWESSGADPLSRSIRAARVDLLAEHTGLATEECARWPKRGLVRRLNRLADRGDTRLRHHPLRSTSEEYGWLTTIFPDGLPFDPRGPVTEEPVSSATESSDESFFTRGITGLKSWLKIDLGAGRDQAVESEQVKGGMSI
jgi:phosphatidylserine/phosphatidylglycerophosphate/cardiolipin synthase-like enzyme